ncbi:ABC transporter ATP-binding protein [Citricoccus sp. I39-566]|uniref:ABC transporter ATP-binding protein n=1 Tax=Citricoccus sp. I39-566 TaxID=3073268 RepID=UPI00286C760D|nr:ABC transporter ATP-binding protein [Citricoccus sp. I39-566]WMY78455.1 ABC transporter ATP-binding protein [Citricoccus sp. I39-566]
MTTRVPNGGVRPAGSTGAPEAEEPLLSLRDVSIQVPSSTKTLTEITHGVSFDVARGGSVGLVGESGSGKSMTSLAIMGLLPKGSRIDGSITFDGTDLIHARESVMRPIRGDRIAMIFQDPLSSLNPYFTVGDQVMEAYLAHNTATRKEAFELTCEAMERVGIPRVKDTVNQFPHQFSGGMRQRIMIAMALVCQPDLLIADEPTTALDVTVQARVLDLIRTLQAETGAGLVFITHDLAVVSTMTKEVVVLQNGSVQEQGRTRDVFVGPTSAYTRKLIDATPRMTDARLPATLQHADGSGKRDPWEGAGHDHR